MSSTIATSERESWHDRKARIARELQADPHSLDVSRWRRVSPYGFEPNDVYPENDKPIDRQQVALCRVWLREFVVPTSTVRRDHSSYGLKHLVEAWDRANGGNAYIANGAFIQAAIEEGYRIVRTMGGCLNAHFAFRMKRGRELDTVWPDGRPIIRRGGWAR